MTFEQFQATRKASDNLARDCESFAACSDGIPVQPGNTYCDGSLFIEAVQDWWPEAAKREGKWHLLLENSEYMSNDLAELERALYEWAMRAGFAPDQGPNPLALEICRKWVARIGGGFHPDTRGSGYSPPFDAATVEEYDADMARLWEIPGDPYEAGIAAMKEAGLTH